MSATAEVVAQLREIARVAVHRRDARRRRAINSWLAVRDKLVAAARALGRDQPLGLVCERLAKAASLRALAWAAVMDGKALAARHHRRHAAAAAHQAARLARDWVAGQGR
jgi:hypothetical protein